MSVAVVRRNKQMYAVSVYVHMEAACCLCGSIWVAAAQEVLLSLCAPWADSALLHP